MNARKLAILPAVAAGILSLWQPLAQAGVFSVTPVRIHMGPRDRAVAVTVTNEGNTELVLQADLSTWSQTAEGLDQMTPTEDLILAPPILKLAPNARQVVRLALLKPADASRQSIYRLVMREVPEVQAARSGIQVPIALAISMPVFVTPVMARRELNCSVIRKDPATLDAMCSNTGTAYAQVREASVKRGDQMLARFEGGTYILPGASRASPMKTTSSVAAGPAQLHIAFDDGKTQVFEVAVP
jgi:fimbrial chaperone protein